MSALFMLLMITMIVTLASSLDPESFATDTLIANAHSRWQITFPSSFTLPVSFHISPSSKLLLKYTCVITNKQYTIPCQYSRPLTHITPRLKVVMPVPVRKPNGKVVVVRMILRGKFKSKLLNKGVVKFYGYVEGGEVRGRRIGEEGDEDYEEEEETGSEEEEEEEKEGEDEEEEEEEEEEEDDSCES